jgi:hypothetical protein
MHPHWQQTAPPVPLESGPVFHERVKTAHERMVNEEKKTDLTDVTGHGLSVQFLSEFLCA